MKEKLSREAEAAVNMFIPPVKSDVLTREATETGSLQENVRGTAVCTPPSFLCSRLPLGLKLLSTLLLM